MSVGVTTDQKKKTNNHFGLVSF